MLFDDDLDAVFGRPQTSQGGNNTTRILLRQISKQNPAFRKFARDPFGRAMINTATLLARISMEQNNRSNNGFERALGEDFDLFSSANTATKNGKLNSRSAEYATADVVLDLVEGLVSQALARRKVTTTTSESERSQQTQKLWNSSRSERDAQLARIVQRGMGEL